MMHTMSCKRDSRDQPRSAGKFVIPVRHTAIKASERKGQIGVARSGHLAVAGGVTDERRGRRGRAKVTMFHQELLTPRSRNDFLFLDQNPSWRFGSLRLTRYSLSTVNYLSFGPLQPYWLTKFGLNLIFGLGDRSRNLATISKRVLKHWFHIRHTYQLL